MQKEDFLKVYRHSLSHVMAKAVMELFGKDEVQISIGPQIADGFYYDFILPRAVTKDDYKKIEDRMHEILLRKEPWTRKVVSKQEALDIFKDQKFKVELINDLPEDETISVYYTGDDFVDLCRGPHVDNSQELLSVAYKIKSSSSSYWRGDEHRDQLQRIYCYAFPSKKELKEHLALVKEAQERDHKKLGPALDLFMFDPTAPGMPYWLPRGWNLFNALLAFWRKEHLKYGYQEIAAPILNSKEIWEKSGHWGHYMENMFLVPTKDTMFTEPIDTVNDKMMAAKPMNCPNAIMVYNREIHSYRDLPVRISETSVIHRREKSGELNGLFRVQEFRQDDAHILLAVDQIEEEIDKIMELAGKLYGTFGLSYTAELSTRPDDFMGDIESWDHAEAALKKILDKKYGEGKYEINEGDGAFYGPKIDLQMFDCLGRQWQMGTIQLDFQLPQNFDMKYTDKDGQQKCPVMIHRALFGSMERFIGILIENFKGAFPFWLSPVQVGIVPIRTENNEYAKKVADTLLENDIRFEVDYAEKNMKEKIKAYKNYKDPYILVLGKREAENGTVSINVRGSNKQIQDVPMDTFLEMCRKMNREHSLDLIESID
ncbi:MAG: threonine--tRNA ligase [Anaerovoracaceae bacterium]|jgi:threonyl-tRNA synthetase